MLKQPRTSRSCAKRLKHRRKSSAIKLRMTKINSTNKSRDRSLKPSELYWRVDASHRIVNQACVELVATASTLWWIIDWTLKPKASQAWIKQCPRSASESNLFRLRTDQTSRIHKESSSCRRMQICKPTTLNSTRNGHTSKDSTWQEIRLTSRIEYHFKRNFRTTLPKAAERGSHQTGCGKTHKGTHSRERKSMSFLFSIRKVNHVSWNRRNST